MTHAAITRPDLCIIGGGAAGVAVATAGVALGLTVTTIERNPRADQSGHDDLILEVLRQAAPADRHRSDRPDAAFRAAQVRMREAIARAAADRSLARLEAMNVRVIRESARFVDSRTIAAGAAILKPRRIILATGAVATPIETLGPLAPAAMSLDEIVQIERLPSRVVIGGAGGRAVALAQSLRRFGAEVALSGGGDPLPDIDSELAEPVLRALRREGISKLPALPESRNWASETVAEDDAIAEGPALIMAAGESEPDLASLELERGQVAVRGSALVLDQALRTTNPRVFAIGAVAGTDSIQAVHAQAGVILRASIFKLPSRFRPHIVPTVVPTSPEIATVGLSEAEAAQRGPVSIARWPLAETDMGRACGTQAGLIKVVTDRRGRILGAGICGGAAREMIGLWALAVERGMTLGDLGGLALPQPSFSEASRRAVLLHVARGLDRTWLKRTAGLLTRWT